MLSKRERSSTASFGPPEQQRQQEEPFTGLQHKDRVWKQQHVGEESPSLQICWVTEIGPQRFGCNQEHNGMRKRGLKLGIHLLAPPLPAKSKAVLAHSVNEIQVPPRSVSSQIRDNRHRFPSRALWQSSSVAGVVGPVLCGTFPPQRASVPFPESNPAGRNGRGLTLQAHILLGMQISPGRIHSKPTSC